ncbi:TadE family protein [Nocardioides sp.]|uniref:TadE family protein n=1 Tax=Nocardioides sp. TaxID=35761 RepID=UPI002719E0D0|nr:TadE/TadG family type IV pilus assembly protein [Nocardioides sp.]MDO9458007.1 TadE/TadG family type IV pilus assembly protein [Nocardioides sp.]
MGRRRRRERLSERGAAAIEFALVSLPLLYLVFGVITYGYMLAFRQSLSQGAAEGARAAAVAPAGFTPAQQTSAARTAVTNSLSTYGMSCGTSGALTRGGSSVGTCVVTVAACTGAATSRCVTVALDYNQDAHPLIPLPGLGLAMPDHLRYTAVAEVS